ncbi:hypothetical protein BBJ28_00024434 [Nothophytophthora sp. Chile5]|nr:hypothetical protein BBJ28_00024434 [Nothophytophthora sp. Chile5]
MVGENRQDQDYVRPHLFSAALEHNLSVMNGPFISLWYDEGCKEGDVGFGLFLPVREDEVVKETKLMYVNLRTLPAAPHVVSVSLEACGDSAAACVELRALLLELQPAERSVASQAAVASLGVRLAAVTLEFLAETDDADAAQLELLDLLVGRAAHELQAPANAEQTTQLQQTLVTAFQLAIAELGAPGRATTDRMRWLQWSEHVLHALFASESRDEALQPQDEGEEGDRREGRRWIVSIASGLLRLRDALEEQAEAAGEPPDLKLMTLAFKVNLSKMATAFGHTLVLASSSDAVNKQQQQDADERETDSFSVDGMLSAVVVSMERSAGRLLRAMTGQATDASAMLSTGGLKLLRLYLRAFERQLVAFANALTCELESSVLALVNVTATLLFALSRNHPRDSSKADHDVRLMLNQTLELAEKLTETTNGKEGKQARRFILTLLWHPTDDMLRAVGQRQPAGIDNKDVDSTIRWGHLLVVTAFSGSGGGGAATEEGAEHEEADDDANRAFVVSQLLTRYRECTLSNAFGRSNAATELFQELLLGALVTFESVAELQLLLLKQTLHPDWAQRTLCWEIWRELLCYCWDEALAVQALETLLAVAQWEDDTDAAFVLARGVDDEILQLIAAVYAEMPVGLKGVCMDQATAVIDAICSEGPSHQFTLRMASQLHLLEKLAAAQFLKEYDGAEKEAWIATHLPMCFECCGTVLQLLTSQSSAPDTQAGDTQGMIRVLDVCLLVLKGVYDDNEPREADVAELSRILVPMVTEAFSQLVKPRALLPDGPRSTGGSRQPATQPTSRSAKLEREAARCVARARETCLYLLTRLGPVVKSNSSNQCVQAMKDVLTLVNQPQLRDQLHDASGTLVTVALFVKTTLFDIQVADGDMAVVWQLLLALFQKLFAASRDAKQQGPRPSLLLSACFDALYELLAHSNVAGHPQAPLPLLLGGGFQAPFVQHVSTRRMGPAEARKAVQTAQTRTRQRLRQTRSVRSRAFRERFPEEPVDEQAEAEEAPDVPEAAVGPSSDADTLPSKRRKLDHVVALCREMESSIASLGSAEAASLLDGEELDAAAAVLRQLLAKSAAFCP